MLQSVNLRDYMLPNPVKVRPDDNVLDAMQVIIDNKISGVCVVDSDGNLVGILSETGLPARGAGRNLQQQWHRQRSVTIWPQTTWWWPIPMKTSWMWPRICC